MPKILNAYTYDFGDDWEHKIELINILNDYEWDYATVTKFKGNCPPEDCGGIWGYEEFLQKYNDNSHKEHEEMIEWATDQGYTDYDIDAVNEELKDKDFIDIKII